MDGRVAQDGVGVHLNDWAMQLASAVHGLAGVECLRVAVTLLPVPGGREPGHASVPPSRLAQAETALAVEEARRTGRIAVAGAMPGTPDSDGRSSCIVVPLEDQAGWVELEAVLDGEDRLSVVIDQVRLALGWVMYLRTRMADGSASQQGAQAVNALQAVVSISGVDSFTEAARSLVTDLCTRFGCDRVSLGLVRRRAVRVVAISHTGTFSRAMALVRLLRAAMEEAVDQAEVLLWPAPAEADDRLVAAQEALAEGKPERSILTIPLFDGRVTHGALVFERDGGAFAPGEITTLEALAGVLAPLINEKRENDRWVPVRAIFALRNILRAAVGRRHFGVKLGILAAAAAVTLMFMVERPMTVVADAVVEGAEQRAITAAFDGFLASADVREGDVVAAGEVLFRLDERDFALDRLRLVALRAQGELELDRAISARDRAETSLVEGRLRQIDAELALVEQQIDRSRVIAPFDALVVSGDLSRSIGSAVSRGETLMVLAPLNEYRVSLAVQETDIARLSLGQTGSLRLAAIPERDFALDLVEMIPVARYENGTTLYSVDARLRGDGGILLHGMTGAARIEIGPLPLIELWGKPLWDEVRLWVWRNLAI